jgi:hypothetical protein
MKWTGRWCDLKEDELHWLDLIGQRGNEGVWVTSSALRKGGASLECELDRNMYIIGGERERKRGGEGVCASKGEFDRYKAFLTCLPRSPKRILPASFPPLQSSSVAINRPDTDYRYNSTAR